LLCFRSAQIIVILLRCAAHTGGFRSAICAAGYGAANPGGMKKLSIRFGITVFLSIVIAFGIAQQLDEKKITKEQLYSVLARKALDLYD
jgi:hypothetical protein